MNEEFITLAKKFAELYNEERLGFCGIGFDVIENVPEVQLMYESFTEFMKKHPSNEITSRELDANYIELSTNIYGVKVFCLKK